MPNPNETEEILNGLPSLDNEMISDLVDDFKTNKLPILNERYAYYKLKHDILNRKRSDSTKPNNKLINDYPAYIVDTIKGYFMGKPVNYTLKENGQKKFIEELTDIYSANTEHKKNGEHAKNCGIYGESFEIVYLNEDKELRFAPMPPTEMFVVYDNEVEPDIQVGVRLYTIKNVSSKTETEHCELYWEDRIQYFERQKGNDWELKDEKEHFFGMVPVVHYKNNEELLGDFDRVKTLIDDYNLRVSDVSNEFEYFGDAYLKIKNMSGTSDEELFRARENRAFFVDGDGDIDFITKQIDTTATDGHITRLEKNIHKFAKVPDLSDENFAGNLSGVAIRYKLWGLEQIAADKELLFKDALYRRMRLLSNIMAIRQAEPLDCSTVEIVFNRNIPSNIVETADIVTKLKGTVSEETLLAQVPFVEDPASEMEKRQKEMTAYNLDGVDFEGNPISNKKKDDNTSLNGKKPNDTKKVGE